MFEKLVEEIQPGHVAIAMCTAAALAGFAAGWVSRARKRTKAGNYVVSIPVWADPREQGGAPTPKADAYVHRTLVRLREENVTLQAKLTRAESDVREVSERLARRVTDARNLEARVRTLEPLADQLKQHVARLAEARTATAAAISERDRLRGEVEWRDYVIRDVEPLAARVAELEAILGDKAPPRPPARAARVAATARGAGADVRSDVTTADAESPAPAFEPCMAEPVPGLAPGVLA